TLTKNIDIQKKIDEITVQIKIQENKELLKDLAENLIENKPCPLCGAIEHPNPIKIIFDNIISSLNNEKIKNEQQFTQNIDYINKLKLKNSIIYKNIENIKIIGIKYKIDNYNGGDNNFIFNENDILKNIYDYEESLNKLNQQLNSIKISNESIVSLQQEKLKELDNNNNLFLQIKNDLDKYYVLLKTDNFYEKYENILNIENIINKNNERYVDINKELSNIDNENTEILNNINDLEKEEISLVTKKQQKILHIGDFDIKIKSLSYNKEPKEYIITIERDINDILINEQKYKDLFDKILQEKDNLQKNINDNLLKLKINEDSINKKSAYIDNFIEKSLFKDKNKILQSYYKKDKKELYEEKIKSYKEKFDDYIYNIKRIEKEFKILDEEKETDINILNEKVEYIARRKKELSVKNSELIENITKLKIDIQQKEDLFKKIEKIEKTIKEEEKKLDLLKELYDLNKGGIFVEYVANTHLKHIVIDASKRLFNMTQSKYSLELIENSFVIKDHYNGGIARSPKSLSGGEVFMASLSLALSLSSKIQLKNKAPLEIFFLDEGFGTLDNNTLDTVINTLEQLQVNDISVGIITHVEEIKNRVQNKITVTSSENGAKINM
ncbi:SbcC/MukB-like Walker B domain-containing protein, partial [uncultured Tyzzerella sp.]|uniref:SbcC/MukB-like Walker B domain-containing protein n=1 Tax=uncultured Tyzzerella sp. TaxID=2321398 RepID=UPI0029426F98